MLLLLAGVILALTQSAAALSLHHRPRVPSFPSHHPSHLVRKQFVGRHQLSSLQIHINEDDESAKAAQDIKEEEVNKKAKKQRQRIPVLCYKNNYVILSKPAGMTMHHSTNKSKWGISKAPILQTAIHRFVNFLLVYLNFSS
jgi:hypothetical protein